MPLLVEQAMYFFNQSIIPDANSVNVFSDPSKMHVTVLRLIDIVKKAFFEVLY